MATSDVNVMYWFPVEIFARKESPLCLSTTDKVKEKISIVYKGIKPRGLGLYPKWVELLVQRKQVRSDIDSFFKLETLPNLGANAMDFLCIILLKFHTIVCCFFPENIKFLNGNNYRLNLLILLVSLSQKGKKNKASVMYYWLRIVYIT